MIEGDVVICATSQAGSIVQIDGKNVWVLLRNHDIWTGLLSQTYKPQSKEHLDACPIDVARVEAKRTIREDSGYED